MLLTGFPAGVFETNCYVLASAPGTECIVVDPGMEAMPTLNEVLTEHRLKPVAVLLTHGHLDHTWSVRPLCEGYDIPAYVHGDDVEMVTDPMTWHGDGIAKMLGGVQYPEFDDVQALADGQKFQIVGVDLTARHTPGHTRGSVVFEFDHPQAHAVLSGDTLFQGSVGRTDLPGGSPEDLMKSIQDVCLAMADDTVVLPGHGGQTTIGDERRTNPFLQGLH